MEAAQAVGVLQMKQRRRIYYTETQKAVMWKAAVGLLDAATVSSPPHCRRSTQAASMTAMAEKRLESGLCSESAEGGWATTILSISPAGVRNVPFSKTTDLSGDDSLKPTPELASQMEESALNSFPS
ncbi:hypothetical protein HDG36_003606 [Paraburkholderia sp. Kb1A]|nr:hypothetical protein [Paraburkholderia sp. Kb1A]